MNSALRSANMFISGTSRAAILCSRNQLEAAQSLPQAELQVQGRRRTIHVHLPPHLLKIPLLLCVWTAGSCRCGRCCACGSGDPVHALCLAGQEAPPLAARGGSLSPPDRLRSPGQPGAPSGVLPVTGPASRRALIWRANLGAKGMPIWGQRAQPCKPARGSSPLPLTWLEEDLFHLAQRSLCSCLPITGICSLAACTWARLCAVGWTAALRCQRRHSVPGRGGAVAKQAQESLTCK